MFLQFERMKINNIKRLIVTNILLKVFSLQFSAVLIVLFSILWLSSCTSPSANNKEQINSSNNSNKTNAPIDSLKNISSAYIKDVEIPETQPGEVVISHTAYTLSYNSKFKQSNWVAYELTGKETNSLYERANEFTADPNISTGTASDKDYKSSGYDKGHLAPAADMGWSSVTMKESFFYSNVSPQLPGFNRGIWKELEELVRTWAIENDTVYVVTGPVLTKDLPTIGIDNVSVPKYFYKVVLDYSNPEIKGIGFIFPNASSDKPLQNFAVSIDSVEIFTGINFFPLLPDAQENTIEKNLCITCWSWGNSKNTKKIKVVKK